MASPQYKPGLISLVFWGLLEFDAYPPCANKNTNRGYILRLACPNTYNAILPALCEETILDIYLLNDCWSLPILL